MALSLNAMFSTATSCVIQLPGVSRENRGVQQQLYFERRWLQGSLRPSQCP